MIHERKLQLLMDGLGFRERDCGTDLVRQGVRIMDADPTARMMKEVYPVIGEAARMNYRQVERNMRGAVQAAMRSPTWGVTWQGIGGWGRPSNCELLRRLARESAIED